MPALFSDHQPAARGQKPGRAAALLPNAPKEQELALCSSRNVNGHAPPLVRHCFLPEVRLFLSRRGSRITIPMWCSISETGTMRTGCKHDKTFLSFPARARRRPMSLRTVHPGIRKSTIPKILGEILL
jgi:hypothetical protein